MQKFFASESVSSRYTPLVKYPSAPVHHCRLCADDSRADTLFVAMLNSYRGSGGLAREQEVIALFKRHGGSDVDLLPNWIAKREVICFDWGAETWLPWFQFKHLDVVPQLQLGQVFTELVSVYDPWELANWFVQPNPWLANRTPVDTFVSDPTEVLNAARADRFIDNY